MPTVRCTRKLLNLLGCKPSSVTNIASDNGAIRDWFANVFYVGGRKNLLFTHAATLFSFVRMDVTKADLRDFGAFFGEGLRQAIGIHKFDRESAMKVLQADKPIVIEATNNRRVLGSMNDLVEHVRCYLAMRGGLAASRSEGLIPSLNQIPMGLLNYDLPVERFVAFVSSAGAEPNG